MKKLFALLLALMMVLSLAACGGGDDEKTPSSDDKAPSSTQQQEQNTPDPGTSGQAEKATIEDYAASVLDYVKGRHSAETFIYYSYTTSGLVEVYACDQDTSSSDNCIVTEYWGYNGRQSAYERDKEADLIGNNVERTSVEVTWNDELLCYSYESLTNPNTWATVESHAADYTVAQERGESAAQSQGGEGQVGGNWPDNEFTKLVPKPDFELSATSGDDRMFTVAFSNATIEGIREYAEKLKDAGFTVDAEVTDSEAMGMTIYTYIASNGKGVTAELAFGLGASSLALKKE